MTTIKSYFIYTLAIFCLDCQTEFKAPLNQSIEKQSIDPPTHENMETDLIIKEIKESLPLDWEMVQTDSNLVLKGNFIIYELYENKINAPVNTSSQEENNERIKKYGKEMFPYIAFSLHPLMNEAQLAQVSKGGSANNYNVLDSFIKNAQIYSLKAEKYAGMEDSFHSVYYPNEKNSKTESIYQLLNKILTPIEVKGKAANAKLGACILTEEMAAYYILGKPAWEESYLGKNIAVEGLLIHQSFEENLVNEKGEYKSGAQGTQTYLINVKIK